MWRRVKLLTLIIGTIIALVLASLPLTAQARLTEQSKVALNGIGPIRVESVRTEYSSVNLQQSWEYYQ